MTTTNKYSSRQRSRRANLDHLMHMKGLVMHSSRRKLGLLLAGAGTAFLTGCGGGGGSDNTRDLSVAYDGVTQGMSYAQVRDLTGYEYNAGKIEAPSETTFSWSNNENSQAVQLLTVSFDGAGGANLKIIQTPTRNESLSWK